MLTHPEGAHLMRPPSCKFDRVSTLGELGGLVHRYAERTAVGAISADECSQVEDLQSSTSAIRRAAATHSGRYIARHAGPPETTEPLPTVLPRSTIALAPTQAAVR